MRFYVYQRACLAAGLLVAALSACNNPAGSKNREKGITVVSGAGVSDTISAKLPQPLVVEVRDASGEPRAGVAVRFESPMARLNGAEEPAVLFSVSTPDHFIPALETVTDATGRAFVRVRLGSVATRAEVRVTAPTVGVEGTAEFTIKPGAPAGLALGPADTAVYVGNSYTLRAATVDRRGNVVTSLTGSLANNSPSVVSVGSDGAVRGQAVGRGSITMAAAGGTMTARVTVVPRGTLLASDGGGIYAFNLDGSEFRRVVSAAGARSPRWMPNGQSFVFNTGLSHGFVTTMDGSMRPLVQGTHALAGQLWAHPSRDGQWIYFGGYDTNYRGYPYRVKADGTGLQLVPGFTANDRNQSHPSPSPGGERVAYFHEAFGDSRDVTLRILNMQTGQLVLQGIPGHSPEWSHGDTIAYLDTRGSHAGAIRLMSSAGAGHRAVSDGVYGFGMDWSPDDRWIAATDAQQGRLEVIQVSTGLRLPLPFTRGMFDPAWRP